MSSFVAARPVEHSRLQNSERFSRDACKIRHWIPIFHDVILREQIHTTQSMERLLLFLTALWLPARWSQQVSKAGQQILFRGKRTGMLFFVAEHFGSVFKIFLSVF